MFAKGRKAVIILLIALLACLAGCGRSEEGSGEQKEENSGGEAKFRQESLSDFDGKRIGIQTGSVFDKALEAKVKNPQEEYYNTFPDMLEALKSGKLDGFVVDEPMGRMMVNEVSGVGMFPEYLDDAGYAIALPKGSDSLRESIDEILSKMKEDGTLKELDAKWFGTDEEAKKLPELALTGENGTLKLATNSGQQPFSYIKDNQVTGYEIEIMMRICDELGYGLEISDMDFAAIIPGLVSGKYDIACACITVTDERKQSVDFTQDVYEGGMAIMAETVGGEVKKPLKEQISESFYKSFVKENRWQLILRGLGVTLVITCLAGVLGSILGFLICMMRRSARVLLRALAIVYIRLIQGTPVVVLLMILFYLVFSGVDVNAVLIAVAGFSVNFAAYVSEMIRTGIEAVDKGQIEAASALGFRNWQVFWKITFPQAASHFLPVFKGEFISMLKMTSVVGYIAIQDLTKMSDIIRSRTYDAFFPLLSTAAIYFLLSWLLTFILGSVERYIRPKRGKNRIKGVKTV